MPGGKRSDAWNVVANGGAANGFFVVEGFAPERSIDDQIDFASLDQIDDVWAAFIYFKDALGLDPCSVQSSGGAASSGQLKAQRRELLANGGEMLFVAVVDAEENSAFARQALPCGQLCFGKSLAIRR